MLCDAIAFRKYNRNGLSVFTAVNGGHPNLQSMSISHHWDLLLDMLFQTALKSIPIPKILLKNLASAAYSAMVGGDYLDAGLLPPRDHSAVTPLLSAHHVVVMLKHTEDEHQLPRGSTPNNTQFNTNTNTNTKNTQNQHQHQCHHCSN